MFFCFVFLGRVQRVGNPIYPSNAGVDVPGATFILNDQILTSGTVYAFRAFFRSESPVNFQIWRPDNSTNSTDKVPMELIYELRVSVQLENYKGRTDVKIPSKETVSNKIIFMHT